MGPKKYLNNIWTTIKCYEENQIGQQRVVEVGRVKRFSRVMERARVDSHYLRGAQYDDETLLFILQVWSGMGMSQVSV